MKQEATTGRETKAKRDTIARKNGACGGASAGPPIVVVAGHVGAATGFFVGAVAGGSTGKGATESDLMGKSDIGNRNSDRVLTPEE